MSARGTNASQPASKGSGKGNKPRDPAASAMAASLGIDTSAFDLPEEDTSFQMSAEDGAYIVGNYSFILSMPWILRGNNVAQNWSVAASFAPDELLIGAIGAFSLEMSIRM